MSANSAAVNADLHARPAPKLPSRRALLASTALLLITQAAGARTLAGGAGMPWRPFAGDPPQGAKPGPWVFFTPEEGAAVEALVDRLIPPDPETPGGKDCGCAVFIDRQLAGAYGRAQGLYMSPPFLQATPEQGLQAPSTPAQLYRRMLTALDAFCHVTYAGKTYTQLPDAEKDRIIAAMENGSLQLQGTSATPFFAILLQDTRYGFLADPVYGGNRDMAAWKMIGFPGARYDYRDWVERHNERYPHPPISIVGSNASAPQQP
jgi:gluconate 2-dehydrogenase gamma chain